jgi:hypothetical protein
MAPERLHRDPHEQDLSTRGSGLQPPDKVQRAGGQVDVGPSEAEQLAFAHPGGEPEDVQRFQPIALDPIQEAPRLLWGEGHEVVAGPARRGD